MTFSILFSSGEAADAPRRAEEPACFQDLNLDQIFAPILKAREKHGLAPFYYTMLDDPEEIRYRQEILRELENPGLREEIELFSSEICEIRARMDDARSDMDSGDAYKNTYLVRGRMLRLALRYESAVRRLDEALSKTELRSLGLREFARWLHAYALSDAFQSQMNRARRIREDFDKLEYCMLIKNGVIRVRPYEGQEDHAKELITLFDRFRQGETKDYRHKLADGPRAEHVEAAVLNLLSRVYPDEFARLNAFCRDCRNFDDDTLKRFSDEVSFYLGWLHETDKLREAGLSLCCPEVEHRAKHSRAAAFYDMALALRERGNTVPNDFRLDAPEQMLVVTGPNQGGKTTFARALGQIHYLAALGLSVPGTSAKLFLPRNVLTHFEREEDLSTLNGKLMDDLVRLRALLDAATADSLIVINEIFSSTTLRDALTLGRRMMDRIAELGAPAVIVTFLDELAILGPKTVSMMSTVSADDQAKRTFKVVRKAPDGLAYALQIAARYALTEKQLEGRLKKCARD